MARAGSTPTASTCSTDEKTYPITTNSQPHLLRADHPQPTVCLVIGKTPSEPGKRSNREKRETPFGRAKVNGYGGRLFAGGVPAGFLGSAGSPPAKPAARGWWPLAQAALSIVLSRISRLSRFSSCWLGLVDNQEDLFRGVGPQDCCGPARSSLRPDPLRRCGGGTYTGRWRACRGRSPGGARDRVRHPETHSASGRRP